MSPNAAQNDTDVSRRLRKLALDGEISKCRRCDGMNIDRVTASAPGYAERVLMFFYPRARVSTPPFETPRGRLPKGVPYILNAKHPSWIQRQHDNQLEADFVSDLAAAIRWSFGRTSDEAKG